MGTLAFLSRLSRAINPHLDLGVEKGAHLDLWWETQHSPRVGMDINGNFWSFIKGVKYPFEFQERTWDFFGNTAA